MAETTKKEKFKHALVLALVGIVPSTISGLLAHCQASAEARIEAGEAEDRADENSEAVLGSVKPAFEDLESSLEHARTWSQKVTTELKELNDELGELQKDVAYLKGYVEHDSRGRYKPKTASADKPAPTSNVPMPAPKKPAARLPDNLADAKAQHKLGAFAK